MSVTTDHAAPSRGRAINDVDGILAVTSQPASGTTWVAHGGDTAFTWDYERSRPALSALYEKAKTSQWNASTDLDWSTPVDLEKVGDEVMRTFPYLAMLQEKAATDPDCPLRSWGKVEFSRLGREFEIFQLSQFLHGEQGAFVCTAKICEQVPWVDAKYYAATQTIDEARHVEVFARYLDEKLESKYDCNGHLFALLSDILVDTRWDMTYLGMQILVEGLALAAFGFMYNVIEEPLLKQLLRYVMSDEARHVAFGVLSLKEVYADLTAAEIKERQVFAFEAGLQMRDRILHQDMWERLDVDPHRMLTWQLQNNDYKPWHAMLFSKIVPNLKKLGLLDGGDGWLRERYTEMGVIQFEDWVDTTEEFTALDAFA